MNYFTTVLFLALGVTASRDKPTWQDLRNALDTEDRIWVTDRSYERRTKDQVHSCVNARRLYLNGLEYGFEQYFDIGNQRKRIELYGEISPGAPDTRPFLTVSSKQGEPGNPYTLEYWDNNRHCGVLTFTEDSEFKCELHVWERGLKNRVSCLLDYQRICHDRHSYSVYYDDCLTRTFGK
ncbi:hypothetical protein V5799_033295 [Amblyomma americanum]|uniref:Lipocalin n=1 Tax=Amblyomma americanum TaxID=6943 RepID=A0AAQ4DNQ6_AMBAM